MTQAAPSVASEARRRVTFDTHPERYRHWKLSFDGPIATIALAVDENAGLQPGYTLKLNSYDLGVDIELHDALQRIRFEHPEVRSVVVTSARERVFCSGANIFMLGLASHTWKLNFCKFTNETRNGIEDSSRYSGLKFIAACNGSTAGGGYEIALACDEILLIDDRTSTVSLPEVPLLGVLPGTGGLTRLTDKRRVRHDLADIFCTLTEGVRGERAKEWRLIDDLAKPQQFAAKVRQRALALAAGSDRPANERGVELTPLRRKIHDGGYQYEHVEVSVNAAARTATLVINAPAGNVPTALADIKASGASWWPLAMARELDDAILMLRTNESAVGTWILKTRGSAERVLAVDESLGRFKSDWFVRETIGQLRRTLGRLETSPRSLFAIIDRESCFAGTLFELALAADRAYMLHAVDDATGPHVALSPMNFGAYPTVADRDRLAARFYDDEAQLVAARAVGSRPVGAAEALGLGLVTATPDELDWDHELRIALEERAALSPDALTGLEASLRFGGAETLNTKIFGRLSAWQNWIFTRPNAVGEAGALKVFGTGSKARFDWERA